MFRGVFMGLLLALTALTTAAKGQGADFRLEVGDQVAISVLEDAGLNTTALIRPDGRFTMPIVGTVEAAGRTVESVQSTIRRGLTASFLTPPTVTVSLVALGGGREQPRFFILGEVASPGTYSFEPPMSLLQALAVAGGVGRFAAESRIQVRRKTQAEDSVRVFDYEKALEGHLPSDTIELQDGDVIMVPVRGLFE